MTYLARSALQYFVRHFPVSKGKNRLVSALWKPLSFGEYRTLTTLSQADVKMSCDLTQLLQRHLYFWGSYEEQYCDYWIKFARQSQVIFDVGANAGLYSLLAAAANPQASIHAFEPTKEIVEQLLDNIRLNGIRNVNVNAVGVSRRNGSAILRECRGTDGTNEGMNFVVNSETGTEEGDVAIPLVSLDDYCREKHISRIDILKMDIEGGEYEALLGAENLLSSQSIGCLFIEFIEWAAKRSNHSTADLKDILLKAGYRIYRLGAKCLTPVESEVIPDN